MLSNVSIPIPPKKTCTRELQNYGGRERGDAVKNAPLLSNSEGKSVIVLARKDINLLVRGQVINHQRTIYENDNLPHLHLAHHYPHRRLNLHQQRDPPLVFVLHHRLL